MKKAPTMEALDNLDEIRTSGDIRRLVSNALLALARKEISATDVEAMAKGLDAISNSINTEIKVAKTNMEMQAAGVEITKHAEMGRLLIS
jgi:predicted ATP-grasp superfamily ATP-dependent carboligase